MGYECPVCSTPQADARHLANHMAMTAILGREDHADWLDEHTPGWNEAGEKELAPRVAEHATEKEFPQVFEDTVGGLEEGEDLEDPLEERGGALFDDEGQDHTHGHDHTHGQGHSPPDPADLDDEAQAALEEAREMTRAMLEGEADDGEATDDTDEEPGAGDDDNNA